MSSNKKGLEPKEIIALIINAVSAIAALIIAIQS